MGCFSSYCVKIFLNFLSLAEPALAFLPGLVAQVWLLSQAPLYPFPSHRGGGGGQAGGRTQTPSLWGWAEQQLKKPAASTEQSSRADRCPSPASLIYSPSKTHKHAYTRMGCLLPRRCILSPGALSLMEGGCKHTAGLNPLRAALQICQACRKTGLANSSHCSCKCS